MSRILRRPMFRGGRVDSRGTGITTGLMDGGRVNFATGGDFFTKYILGPQFGGIPTQAQQERAAQSKFTLPPGATEQDKFKMFADLISEEKTGAPTTGDTGLSPSYLTGTKFYETAYGSDVSEAEGLLASTKNVGAGKKIGEEEASEVSISPKPTVEEEPSTEPKGPVRTPKVNEPDTEVTMTDLERALGLDDAKKEYVGDALAAASKAFFEGKGFGAISDAAAVKSKAPDIKRLAGLEKFKADTRQKLYETKLKNQRYAPGNAEKNFKFYISQGMDEDEALNLSMKLARNFDSAFLEQEKIGTVTAKKFDTLARARNIDSLPSVDVQELKIGETYYVPNQKKLVTIVLKEGKKDIVQTQY